MKPVCIVLTTFAWLIGTAVCAQEENPGALLEPLVKPDTSATKPTLVKPKTATKPAPKATETIVGRGSEAAIVTKNGQVIEINSHQLRTPNKVHPTSRITTKPTEATTETKPETSDTGQETTTSSTPPGPRTENDKTAKTDQKAGAQKEQMSPQEKAAQELTRKMDTDRLNALRKEGAWFYSKDNKPIGQEELDQRIRNGDVSGIKTVDIHLQPWETRSKPIATSQPESTTPDNGVITSSRKAPKQTESTP